MLYLAEGVRSAVRIHSFLLESLPQLVDSAWESSVFDAWGRGRDD
jgi:hypothetical protein